MIDRCLWCLEWAGKHVPGCFALTYPLAKPAPPPEPKRALTEQELRDGFRILAAQDPELHAALIEMGAVGPELTATPAANVRLAKLTLRVERLIVAMVIRTSGANGNGAHADPTTNGTASSHKPNGP